eukprot:2952102-Prymnesium_polylepis.4
MLANSLWNAPSFETALPRGGHRPEVKFCSGFRELWRLERCLRSTGLRAPRRPMYHVSITTLSDAGAPRGSHESCAGL